MLKYVLIVFYCIGGITHASDKNIVMNLLVSKNGDTEYISFTNIGTCENEILLNKDISIIRDNIEVKFYDEKTHFLFSVKPDFHKRRLPDWKILMPAQASIVIPFSLDNIFLEKNMKAGKYYIQIHYGHFDLQDKYIILYSSKLIPYLISTKQQDKIISESEAIDIALKANMLNYDKAGKIRVTLERGIYTVILPCHPLPPNSVGPDFAAKIKIDAKTGKVISIMAGS
ncbi:MAG: PepSY domain-containing protein [Lentisphaeria bacterium]|nr:PepSY domain-containing protein [Lentisphaeria bacterium]